MKGKCTLHVAQQIVWVFWDIVAVNDSSFNSLLSSIRHFIIKLNGHARHILIDLEIIVSLLRYERSMLVLSSVWFMWLSHALFTLVMKSAWVTMNVKWLDPLFRLAFHLIRPIFRMWLVLPLAPLKRCHFFIVLDRKIWGSDAPAVHIIKLTRK